MRGNRLLGADDSDTRTACADYALAVTGRCFTAAVNWLMGDEHLDPAWSFGPSGEHFEVEITGDPSCLVSFHKLHPESIAAGLVRNPGVVATAMHCVNAIPYVCVAESGLKTYLDLPLVAGRAASSLGRQRG